MNELLNAAVELMMLGMGTVFVFLVLLIYTTKAMSALVMKTQSEEPQMASGAAPRQQVKSSAHVQDPKLIKAIGEAIKQHRSNS